MVLHEGLCRRGVQKFSSPTVSPDITRISSSLVVVSMAFASVLVGLGTQYQAEKQYNSRIHNELESSDDPIQQEQRTHRVI